MGARVAHSFSGSGEQSGRRELRIASIAGADCVTRSSHSSVFVTAQTARPHRGGIVLVHIRRRKTRPVADRALREVLVMLVYDARTANPSAGVRVSEPLTRRVCGGSLFSGWPSFLTQYFAKSFIGAHEISAGFGQASSLAVIPAELGVVAFELVKHLIA
jgi:hypothetical protein